MNLFKHLFVLSALLALTSVAHANESATEGEDAGRDTITDVLYSDTVDLKYCGGVGGGTVSTGCNDQGTCFINVKNSQCKGLRLYDTVVKKPEDPYYFQKTIFTETKNLSGVDGSYTDSIPLSTYDWNRNWNKKSRFKYYVTAFLYRTDRPEGRPYEKILLWFYHKPGQFEFAGQSTSTDRDFITDVLYGDTVSLRYCGGEGGGTVSSGCNDHGTCYINIKNSQCKGLRLYDTVVNKPDDHYYFQKTFFTDFMTLKGYDGSYTSSFPLKTYEWNRNWDYSSRYKYYVTAFLYRTDQPRPYEKILLWFYHKP